MKDNPILRKIGLIEHPFKRNVINKYSAAVIELVKKEKGGSTVKELIDAIYSTYININQSKKSFYQYLTNEHEWMHGLLYLCICELGRELTQKDNFYYLIGKNSLDPGFLHITTSKFLDINTIYRYVQKQNKNFNNLIDLNIDRRRFRNGTTVFYRKTHDFYKNELQRRFGTNLTYKILKNDCTLTKGVLETVPLRYKKRPAVIIKEPKCEGRGDVYCELHLKWEPERLKEKLISIANIIPNYFSMKEKLVEMEAVIKERTEELEKSKKDVEESYNEIRILKDALGEKEPEALLNTAFSYIDEGKAAKSEKALDLIINKKDTIVYQYETSSLSNVYFFNKKKVRNIKDIWVIKRYENTVKSSIAYYTYKRLREYGRLADVKVPRVKMPLNKYLIVQEIEGMSLYDLFSRYRSLGKDYSSVFDELIMKHISDTAFIQSLHINSGVTMQSYPNKMVQSLKTLFDHFKIRYDLQRIKDLSKDITKNFTKGMLRHRDSSLKNTRIRCMTGLENLNIKKDIGISDELYQIDFEKMDRLTFQSDNIMRITESPVLRMPDKKKMEYHHLFILCHKKYTSRSKEKEKASKIDICLKNSISREEIIRAIGRKRYKLYFLAHNEKMFYRNLRSIYHQLKPENERAVNFEHIEHNKNKAIRLSEKIMEESRKGAHNLEYIKTMLERIQT
ncbi:hypothetical protein KY366_05935 [Candidatus Woesearchaeota archaeon]|nr:hypothetical protein [Candidatus Woesearchaeota archaeon]